MQPGYTPIRLLCSSESNQKGVYRPFIEDETMSVDFSNLKPDDELIITDTAKRTNLPYYSIRHLIRNGQIAPSL